MVDGQSRHVPGHLRRPLPLPAPLTLLASLVAGIAACAAGPVQQAPPEPAATSRPLPVRPPADGSAAAGQLFVTDHCSTCHAVGRSGDSPVAEAPAFRDLSARYPLENLAEALGEGIFVGHPLMPAFELTPGEVDSVIAWLRAVQEPPAAEGP